MRAGLAGLSLLAAVPAQGQAIATVTPQTIDFATSDAPMAMLREVFPDLDAEGHAGRSNPVPGAPDAVADYEGGPADLGGARAVMVGGRYRFAMAAGVLMLAETAPADRYHGAMFVQSDPGGPPSLERAFLAAPGLPMALVGNRHFNSQEGFENYAIYTLVSGRLEQVYAGPILYSLSVAGEKCDALRTLQRLAGFRPVKAGAAIRIELRVTEELVCETAKGSRTLKTQTFPIRLTWDARAHRFTGSSPALEQRTRERMGE
jgi:hypothetical protein